MANLIGKNIIYTRSMGKCFRVTAIFDNDDEANTYMASAGKDEGVISVIGNHVYLANLHDRGIKDPNNPADFRR